MSRQRRLVMLSELLLCLGCAAQPMPNTSSTSGADDALRDEDADSFRYQRPPTGHRPAASVPPPEVLKLRNGFELHMLPWDASTVALRVTCRAGAALDPLGKSGLASLTHRMLTEGTRDKTALEQAILMENFGASLDSETGHESASLSVEVLHEHVAPAIEQLGEALRHPGFREANFTTARGERLDDLRAERQDPDQVAWLLAQRALLGPRWGRSSTGSPGDVEDLGLEDLVAFHRRHTTPARCALMAAGSTDIAGLRTAAEATFGDWVAESAGRSQQSQESTSELPKLEARPRAAKVFFYERDNGSQSSVVVATRFPPRLEPGREARLVINNLFGGLFTSRLNSNLRERNAYTYGAFSVMLEAKRWGALMLSSSVQTPATAKALEQMQLELARLGTEPPQQREVTSATADLIQRRLARLEHTSRLLGALEEQFVFELPAAHFTTFTERLTELDNAELQATAKAFGEAPRVVVVVGDPSARRTLQKASVEIEDADPRWLE